MTRGDCICHLIDRISFNLDSKLDFLHSRKTIFTSSLWTKAADDMSRWCLRIVSGAPESRPALAGTKIAGAG